MHPALAARLVSAACRLAERSHNIRLQRFCALLALSILSSGIAFSQAVSATLLGTVTDASGAVVASAKVTTTEDSTGVSRSGQTNDSGNYTFPNLPPGRYSVTVEASGFEPGARFERSWIKTKPGLVPHGRKRS